MDGQEQESAGFYVHCPVNACMHERVLLAFFYFSKSPKLLACPFLMSPFFTKNCCSRNKMVQGQIQLCTGDVHVT